MDGGFFIRCKKKITTCQISKLLKEFSLENKLQNTKFRACRVSKPQPRLVTNYKLEKLRLNILVKKQN